ncbi:MAG: hypothetical protein K8U57_21520 [Planctomycetes bacterium]|nr:hypothetical protein [Planctomycetota bacterium]
MKDAKKAFNLLLFFAQVWSLPLEVYVRRGGTWGSKYMGFHCLLGMLFIPVFGAILFPKDDQTPFFGFMVFTGLMLVAHRIEGWKKQKAGYVVHSRYSGQSIFPGNEFRAKSVFEPALLAAVGGAVLYLSVPLGMYLMGGSVALSLVYSMAEEQDMARVRQMRDAQIEARYYAERARESE